MAKKSYAVDAAHQKAMATMHDAAMKKGKRGATSSSSKPPLGVEVKKPTGSIKVKVRFAKYPK